MSILIVISHLYMGGFSKSLINFLHCMEDYNEYDFTILMLEDCSSSLERYLPSGVSILRMDLQHEERILQRLRLEYHHYKYAINERSYRFVFNREPPAKHIREYVGAKDAFRARTLISDFSFGGNYDAVVAWEEGFCNYVLAYCFPNCRKVGYVHPNYADAQFSIKIDSPCFKKLDRIVGISDECCKALRECFPKYRSKVRCVPNRLSIRFYNAMAEEYSPKLDKESFNIVTVARADNASKAIFRMVSLCRVLKELSLGVKWYYIGDGPDYNELQRLISKSNVDDVLICLGALDNPCPYIAKADLYVQQSYYEGRPVSVDEAIVLNTPVLATNYSSAKEQIQDGTIGWIVEDAEDSILRQLVALVDCPSFVCEASEKLRAMDKSSYEDCSAMISMLRELCMEK